MYYLNWNSLFNKYCIVIARDLNVLQVSKKRITYLNLKLLFAAMIWVMKLFRKRKEWEWFTLNLRF